MIKTFEAGEYDLFISVYRFFFRLRGRRIGHGGKFDIAKDIDEARRALNDIDENSWRDSLD